MSFLSSLLGIGGDILAPFTGGVSAAVGNGLASALSGAGKTTGDAAAAMAKQQLAEGQLANQANSNLNQQYGIGQNAQMEAGNLDLARQNFTNENRATTARQALVAALLKNYTPSQVSVPGVKQATISGGLQQALQNPQAQSTLQTLFDQASKAQNTPVSFSGGQILQAPQLTPLPQASGLQNVLGGVGLGSSILGSVLNSINQYKKAQPQVGGDYGQDDGQ